MSYADWLTTGVLALGCAVLLYIGQRALCIRTSFPLPPGPPGLPWVGNVIGVDTDAPWITYTEWARKYGDLVYARLLGKDIIIINSEKVAKELLKNRSSLYSDRPYFIVMKLCGIEFNSAFLRYSERWRLHRRFFHQAFRPTAVSRFLPYQDRKACDLLRRLFDSPEQLKEHVFEYTAAIILNSVYNYDPVSRKDKIVDTVSQSLEIMRLGMRPDISTMLGAFPWLLYLPPWLPGMSFKRDLDKANECSKQYLELPFNYAVQKAAHGIASSMVHDALGEMEKKGASLEKSWMYNLKQASGTAFLAGSETSDSVLMTFFLMMVLNPEVQEKARAQIDALLKNTKLPTSENRPHLPLVDAIFWETLRYGPIAPLSIPRATMEEDVYGGFRIPKGKCHRHPKHTMSVLSVFVNSIPTTSFPRAMAHDEKKFPNPQAFVPERFLNDDGSLKGDMEHMEHIAFGFGRRICVGRHLAANAVWLAMAKVLAVFEILKPLDENGVEMSVEPKFLSGIAIQPVPFECRIVPRFPEMDAQKLETLITASNVGQV